MPKQTGKSLDITHKHGGLPDASSTSRREVSIRFFRAKCKTPLRHLNVMFTSSAHDVNFDRHHLQSVEKTIPYTKMGCDDSIEKSALNGRGLPGLDAAIMPIAMDFPDHTTSAATDYIGLNVPVSVEFLLPKT